VNHGLTINELVELLQ